MITYFDGTVFNVEAHALVNTVNCIGVMGAGIALEFMLRYPKMFEDYEAKCKDKKVIVGQVDYFDNNDGHVIVNFPTKWHFKYTSKIQWIEQGLQHFVSTYKQFGIKSVAYPKLGTSNGGLEWDNVKLIMERYLSCLDIQVYICLDNNKEAAGTEKVMLDKFNSTNIQNLAEIVKLTNKQREKLINNIPYTRFWMIGETESIGMKTYSAFFSHFYNLPQKGDKQPQQMTLFD